jgi:hypothetical protein
MIHFIRFLPLVFLFASALDTRGELPAQPLVTKGKVLFSDNFERREPGPAWEGSMRSFTIVDGALKGGHPPGVHGAIAAIQTGFKDGIIEFRFRFEGAAAINAVCDDKAWQGSHAGHICRVSITPRVIRLGDDKEGGMRNDILEMRKDPARKAEMEKLLIGRTAAFPAKIEPQTWHRITIEIAGDKMRVSLDDKPIGYLQSPGIAHPTKTRFHFTVNGKDAMLDDVRIFAAASTGK